MGSLSEYERTCGAVHSIGWHMVWCPKYRKRVLRGRVAARLAELISQRTAERGWSVETLEITPDLVHLVPAPPAASPAHVAHQFMGFTSRVLRSEFRNLHTSLPMLWSKSYFVASVGRVWEGTIRKYIEGQTPPGKR